MLYLLFQVFLLNQYTSEIASISFMRQTKYKQETDSAGSLGRYTLMVSAHNYWILYKWEIKNCKGWISEEWHPTEISLTALQVVCSVLSPEEPPLTSDTAEGPPDTATDGFIATYSGWLRYEERHGGEAAALGNDKPSAEEEKEEICTNDRLQL